VREHLSNPSLSSEGAVVLQTVAEQCDVVEAHWSELEMICQMMPQTLLHGDFVIKNLRVRPAADGPQLLVFDWEYAGWGAPGTDLAQFTGGMASPDLAVYRCCLNVSSMMQGDAQVEQLANCGRLFRMVNTMYWASLGMVAGPPDFLLQPISELAIYSKRMARALSEAGWTTHDKGLASVASLARSEARAIRSTDAERQGSEDDV